MARRQRRTIDSEVATLLHLPPEICALICSMVEFETLLKLCRVSHSFRNQTQRIVYRSVNLQRCSRAKRMTWFRSMSRNPQLGAYLHTLRIPPIDLEEGQRLAFVLKKCPHLNVLDFQGLNVNNGYSCDAIHTWVIDNMPFRLTHFTNSYFRSTFLTSFWKKQTGIKVLSLPLVSSADRLVFPCHDGQLPNLIGLEVPNTLMLPTNSRPLQRIQLQGHLNARQTMFDLTVLARFSSTLTTLNLCLVAMPPFPSTLHTIAQAVPNLTYLGLADKVFPWSHQQFPRSELLALKRLKNLVILSHHTMVINDASNAQNYTFRDLRSMTQLFMDTCPSLEQTIIGRHGRVRDLAHGQLLDRTCRMQRVKETKELVVEMQGDVDFDVVAKFWDA
ncbi:hypothetical protein MIND_00115000 [Mycena indigotica]|uniref:F-box domain-containing protein n=1 Tax=Mycena indigotica TaxID=2126181 RepID=A0A8H6TBZ8_9AGAR|nr:uncharacterized protein MIND_00115000 [Mycena indigotica]KAF7315980.1 hypothetical protein MIND_00115000 [Mycena indigotica]